MLIIDHILCFRLVGFNIHSTKNILLVFFNGSRTKWAQETKQNKAHSLKCKLSVKLGRWLNQKKNILMKQIQSLQRRKTILQAVKQKFQKIFAIRSMLRQKTARQIAK